MLFETVTINGATVLVQIALWSWLAWTVTYWYMSRKVSDLEYKVEILDCYIYETDQELNLMIEERAGKDEYMAHLKSIIEGDEIVEYVVTEKGNWILKGADRD